MIKQITMVLILGIILTGCAEDSVTRVKPSSAQQVPLVNGGFEAPDAPDGEYIELNNSTVELPGWDKVWQHNLNVGAVHDPAPGNVASKGDGKLMAETAAEGEQCFYAEGWGMAIGQETEAIEQDTLYTLTFSFWSRPNRKADDSGPLVQLHAKDSEGKILAAINPARASSDDYNAREWNNFSLSWDSTGKNEYVGMNLYVHLRGRHFHEFDDIQITKTRTGPPQRKLIRFQ